MALPFEDIVQSNPIQWMFCQLKLKKKKPKVLFRYSLKKLNDPLNENDGNDR